MGNRTVGGRLKPKPNDAKSPLTCTGCNAVLKVVTYTLWGTKRWDPKTRSYDEDDYPGKTDLEFRCPNCSAELDAAAILGIKV